MASFEEITTFLNHYSETTKARLTALAGESDMQLTVGETEIRVSVLESHGVVLILSPIMPVPGRNRTEFFRKLLELSFLATSDASFAIDKKTDLVYVRIFRGMAHLQYDDFAEHLSTVAAVSAEWESKLRDQFPA